MVARIDEFPPDWSAQDIAYAKMNAWRNQHPPTCSANRRGGDPARCDCGQVPGVPLEVMVKTEDLLAVANLLHEITWGISDEMTHEQIEDMNRAYGALVVLPAHVRHAMTPPLYSGVEIEEQRFAEAVARQSEEDE